MNDEVLIPLPIYRALLNVVMKVHGERVPAKHGHEMVVKMYAILNQYTPETTTEHEVPVP